MKRLELRDRNQFYVYRVFRNVSLTCHIFRCKHIFFFLYNFRLEQLVQEAAIHLSHMYICSEIVLWLISVIVWYTDIPRFT
jgi:hypothetical protein